ncbi:MAG: aminoglycoside phosphotransferase family protein [Hyphomonadaceae bacterium]
MVGTPKAEVDVTPGQVRDLLADQHPRFAALPVSLAGEGWDNFTFRLGDDLAIRLPRREASVQLLVNEQRLLPRIAANLPLPIPSPVAIGQPGRGYPWTWSVVPWIAGQPADQAPLADTEGAALACFLQALHVLAPPDAPDNQFRGIRLSLRHDRIVQVLERLKAVSDVITPAISQAWEDAVAAPIHDGPPLWIHGDIHAQNVLSDKGRLASVIDWGDMASGDPAVDLSAVWGVLDHRRARAEARAIYNPDDARLARARGWAVLFGATLFENGRIDDPRHAATGEATLRRLAEDLAG